MRRRGGIRASLERLPVDVKALVVAETLIAGICAYRYFDYWTTGFFAPDEFTYYRDAVAGSIYSLRWFFGGFNILVFHTFGIGSVDAFSVMLPFYGFFWSSLTLAALFLILRRLGFGGVTAGLSIISCFTAISFIIVSDSFLTEPVGLACAMWGVYFLVRFYQAPRWREAIAFPLFSALAFGAATGTRQPYSTFALGGIAVFAVAAYLRRHDNLRLAEGKGKYVLVVSVLAFALPSTILLDYPSPILSQQVAPLVISLPAAIQSNIFPPAVGGNQTVSSTLSESNTVSSTVGGSHTVSSTLSESSTVSSTTSKGGGTSGRAGGSSLKATFLIFLAGIGLGWGPIAGVLGVVGLVAMLRLSILRRNGMATVLLLLCAAALASYFGTSYVLGEQHGYLSTAHFSTMMRYSSTTLPALFLATPFVLTWVAKTRRRYLTYFAVLAVVFLLAVPSYETYAASNVRFVQGNPFSISYRTNAVEVRDFLQKVDPSGGMLLGAPHGWSFTPGTQAINGLSTFSPIHNPRLPLINKSQFYSSKPSPVYLYTGADYAALSDLPEWTQSLVQGQNASLGSLPYTVVMEGEAYVTPTFTLYRVVLLWNP